MTLTKETSENQKKKDLETESGKWITYDFDNAEALVNYLNYSFPTPFGGVTIMGSYQGRLTAVIRNS